MDWDQIEVSWKRLKDRIVFRWDRLTDDNGKRVELIGAEISGDSQSHDARMMAFRPDDPGSGASFHSTSAVN